MAALKVADLQTPKKRGQYQGTSGFGNPDYRFRNKTQNPENRLQVDFNLEIQIRISCISFCTVLLGNPRKICKTILVNSARFSANYACACETSVFLRTGCGFPNKTERNWEVKDSFFNV